MASADEVQRRRDAEEALLDREGRLQAILDAAVDGIITIDERGIIESFNRAAERMFGWTADEAVGRNISMLLPSPYREEHDRYLAKYLETGEGKIVGVGREVVGLRKDGATFPIDLAVSEIRLGDQRLFTGIVRDITDRKRTDERLLQAERLAAIGEAMAGLAHESRNALQRSQASLEMLARRVEDRPDAARLIQRVQKAQDDLHQLYEDVREYSAPIKLTPQRCDLSEILREAWEHLHVQRQGRTVRLRETRQTGLADGGPETDGNLALHCSVDSFAIRQVFRNVLENSLAACDDPVEIDVRYSIVPMNNRPAVKFVLRDNGRGLTSEARERIFDAFYTTKTNGTGLGMAIAKRFVEAHAGRIEIGSNVNEAAEIVIILPREQP